MTIPRGTPVRLVLEYADANRNAHNLTLTAKQTEITSPAIDGETRKTATIDFRAGDRGQEFYRLSCEFPASRWKTWLIISSWLARPAQPPKRIRLSVTVGQVAPSSPLGAITMVSGAVKTTKSDPSNARKPARWPWIINCWRPADANFRRNIREVVTDRDRGNAKQRGDFPIRDPLCKSRNHFALSLGQCERPTAFGQPARVPPPACLRSLSHPPFDRRLNYCCDRPYT